MCRENFSNLRPLFLLLLRDAAQGRHLAGAPRARLPQHEEGVVERAQVAVAGVAAGSGAGVWRAPAEAAGRVRVGGRDLHQRVPELSGEKEGADGGEVESRDGRGCDGSWCGTDTGLEAAGRGPIDTSGRRFFNRAGLDKLNGR